MPICTELISSSTTEWRCLPPRVIMRFHKDKCLLLLVHIMLLSSSHLGSCQPIANKESVNCYLNLSSVNHFDNRFCNGIHRNDWHVQSGITAVRIVSSIGIFHLKKKKKDTKRTLGKRPQMQMTWLHLTTLSRFWPWRFSHRVDYQGMLWGRCHSERSDCHKCGHWT